MLIKEVISNFRENKYFYKKCDFSMLVVVWKRDVVKYFLEEK